MTAPLLREALLRLAQHLPTRLARPLATVAYLKPAQLAWRITARLHRAQVAVQGPGAHRRLVRGARAARLPVAEDAAARWLPLAEWKLAHAPGSCTADGHFTFLSQQLPLGMPPKWDRAATRREARDPALWHFNLHYFDWLWDLLARGDDEAALGAMEDWIARCLLGARECFAGPWSPYTISLRVPNWLAALALLDSRGALAPARRERILDSALAQLHYLSQHFEYEHRANHLLENVKCLLMGALFFEAPGWRERALRELDEQLREQVLPGGCHYERSPMYHAILLDRLLDLVSLDPTLEPAREAAGRMLSFAGHIACPDGSLPLLGDSAAGIAPTLEQLRARAKLLGIAPGHAPEGLSTRDGHYLFRGTDWLLFDAAPSGPDESGAHQHADLLGFELWLGDIPVVVDAGAGHYGEGPLRDALRSANEHAVVQVDGEGPADPWKSFRLARRGHPFGVRKQQRPNGAFLVEAHHDGFAHRGVSVRRRLLADPRRRLFTIKDRVRGPAHSATVSLPLHPAISVRIVAPHEALLLHAGQPIARVSARANGQPASLVEGKGWRWESFGARLERIVLRAEAHGSGLISLSLEIRAIDSERPHC